MSTTYESERSWNRMWEPFLKEFMGVSLIRESTRSEDIYYAVDLVYPGKVEVQQRVRRPGYRGYNDITVTARRESGAACEFEKMIANGARPDLFCYGHAQHSEPREGERYGGLASIVLVDLRVCRDWMRVNHGHEIGPNKDAAGRRCWFYAFNLDRLIDACGRGAIMRHYGVELARDAMAQWLIRLIYKPCGGCGRRIHADFMRYGIHGKSEWLCFDCGALEFDTFTRGTPAPAIPATAVIAP